MYGWAEPSESGLLNPADCHPERDAFVSRKIYATCPARALVVQIMAMTVASHMVTPHGRKSDHRMGKSERNTHAEGERRQCDPWNPVRDMPPPVDPRPDPIPEGEHKGQCRGIFDCLRNARSELLNRPQDKSSSEEGGNIQCESKPERPRPDVIDHRRVPTEEGGMAENPASPPKSPAAKDQCDGGLADGQKSPEPESVAHTGLDTS